MKGNKHTLWGLFVPVLIIVFALTACAQSENIALINISDDTDIYYAIPCIYNDDYTYIAKPTTDTSENILAPIINLDALRENTFVGGGEGAGIATGGDELAWYDTVFGFLPNGVDAHFIYLVGDGAFDQWRALPRDDRVPFLVAFIDHFNITMEDMIRAQVGEGGCQDRLDNRIYWARYGEGVESDYPHRVVWAYLMFSTSDFEALFSGDINRLWAAFPGSGVVQNGRAYSPEWILNNIRTAVVEEEIPLGEIWRIIYRAEIFPQLEAVAANARAFLETDGVT